MDSVVRGSPSVGITVGRIKEQIELTALNALLETDRSTEMVSPTGLARHKGEIDVLVIDHPVAGDGVTAQFTDCREIRVMGCARSVAEAVIMCQSTPPDIVLLEVVLVGHGAAELIRRLRRVASGARVIIFTAFHDHPAVSQALAAGAWGVLSKEADANLLKLAVREAAFSNPAGRRNVADMRALSLLTPRERDVLRLVAHGATNHEVAAELFLSVNTVKTYLRTTMEKLGARNRVQAVANARAQSLL
ncbi:MAG TPA: response regulator transcription factor [Terrimesophilobacter sp.]|nr:response regulator transcription factor [Terrimesophilobacter sp.]